jgi:DNA-binding transcriptional regulator YiaG
MASFTKLASSSWRVQVRHKGRYVSESFQRREDAVSKWERGEKRPDGPSLKLLNLV